MKMTRTPLLLTVAAAALVPVGLGGFATPQAPSASRGVTYTRYALIEPGDTPDAIVDKANVSSG